MKNIFAGSHTEHGWRYSYIKQIHPPHKPDIKSGHAIANQVSNPQQRLGNL
jgi:hypothetical protein